MICESYTFLNMDIENYDEKLGVLCDSHVWFVSKHPHMFSKENANDRNYQ